MTPHKHLPMIALTAALIAACVISFVLIPVPHYGQVMTDGQLAVAVLFTLFLLLSLAAVIYTLTEMV